MIGHEGRGDWMQTFTGRRFYPLDPRAGDVDPSDIAHALGMICRFGGHLSRFYSVAEHSVLVSRAVDRRYALRGLLHDAGEAYVGDMVRPLKRSMSAYCTAEERVMAAICEKFGIPAKAPCAEQQAVKTVDLRILLDERDALMAPCRHPWASLEGVEPLGVRIEGWAPDVAAMAFLDRLYELVPVRVGLAAV